MVSTNAKQVSDHRTRGGSPSRRAKRTAGQSRKSNCLRRFGFALFTRHELPISGKAFLLFARAIGCEP